MDKKINGGNILYICNGKECINGSCKRNVKLPCHHTTFLEFAKNWDKVPNEEELNKSFEIIKIDGLPIVWVEKEDQNEETMV